MARNIYLKIDGKWLTHEITRCLVGQCWYVGTKKQRHLLTEDEYEWVIDNIQKFNANQTVELVFE